MPARVTISANDLRALAEAADGYRDTAVYVVIDPAADESGARHPYRLVRADSLSDNDIVLELYTESKPKFETRTPSFELESNPKVVIYRADGTEDKRGLAGCDAVFTSLSAVEKFVVPYYARMRSLGAVDKARESFACDPRALAILHLPDSVDETARESGSLFALVASAAWSGDGPRPVELQPLLGSFITDR